MVDGFGTPQSDAVHVVERYRLIDYDAAIEAANRVEKEHIRVTSVPGTTGDGVDVDPNYRGKGLQLYFTVDDANVFIALWSATITYRRPLGEWVEQVCAENTNEYYAGTRTAIPTADKPDF